MQLQKNQTDVRMVPIDSAITATSMQPHPTQRDDDS